jgi:type II secretory pathway pseudopilin PulG
MTRWLPATILGVVASLVVPALASAQSLAEVAAREKERREAAGKKVKSYSEDDLRRSGGAASSFETSSSDDAAAAPTEGAAPAEGASGDDSTTTTVAPKEKGADAQLAEKKAYNEKLQKAQDELNDTAAQIDKIQKDLANNSANYYSAARTEMLNRLDGLTKKYATQKDALESVRAEGRKSFGS